MDLIPRHTILHIHTPGHTHIRCVISLILYPRAAALLLQRCLLARKPAPRLSSFLFLLLLFESYEAIAPAPPRIQGRLLQQ